MPARASKAPYHRMRVKSLAQYYRDVVYEMKLKKYNVILIKRMHTR